MKRWRRRYSMVGDVALWVLLGMVSVAVVAIMPRKTTPGLTVYSMVEGDAYCAVKKEPNVDGRDEYLAVFIGPGLPKYQAMTGGELFALITSASDREFRKVPPTESTTMQVHVYDSGWPLRCFDVIIVNMAGDPGWRHLRGDPSRSGVLPGAIRPLPFAANTAIFAAAWGLLLATARVAWSHQRRRSRRRRGLCLACGYDRAGISTDAVCPECGKAP